MTNGRPFQLGIRTLLLLIYCFAILLIAGGYATDRFNVGYTSHSVFQIKPNWIFGDGIPEPVAKKLVQIGEIPHEERLTSEDNITNCLERNNLFVLDSFVDLTKEESIEAFKSRLTVDKMTEQGGVYRLSLMTKSPQDSATLVNNLVKFYHDSLGEEFGNAYLHGYSFSLLEVAKVGRREKPQSETSMILGILASTILALVTLFPVNPLRPCESTYSIQGLLSTLIFCGGCFLLGFAIVWFTSRSAVQTSEAKIEIKDNLDSSTIKSTPFAQVPHEIMFGAYRNIELALDKNNLFVLDSFVHLAREEVVGKVQQDLQILRSETNPNQLTLSYSALMPKDSKLVLEKIVESYFDSLDRNYSRSTPPWRTYQNSVEDEIGESPGVPFEFETKILKMPSEPMTKVVDASSLIGKLFAGWVVMVIGFGLLWLSTKQRCYSMKRAGARNLE